MPLPMVHLSLAHHLVQVQGYPPSPAFYLGNVAPDAIHMRPDTDREDKWAVHLVTEEGPDLNKLRALIEGHGTTPEDVAFAQGYVVHVLADVYWREEMIAPFQAQLEDRMPRSELRTLYYNECDKVDLELYDRQPWRQHVWELLQSARASDFGGLLSGDEIARWRDRVLSWYDAHRDKGSYQARYVTLEWVRRFIADAAARAHERVAPWISGNGG